jgi:hypothetical protein
VDGAPCQPARIGVRQTGEIADEKLNRFLVATHTARARGPARSFIAHQLLEIGARRQRQVEARREVAQLGRRLQVVAGQDQRLLVRFGFEGDFLQQTNVHRIGEIRMEVEQQVEAGLRAGLDVRQDVERLGVVLLRREALFHAPQAFGHAPHEQRASGRRLETCSRSSTRRVSSVVSTRSSGAGERTRTSRSRSSVIACFLPDPRAQPRIDWVRRACKDGTGCERRRPRLRFWGMKPIRLALAVLLLALAATARAVDLVPSDVHDHVTRRVEQGYTPGVAVGVVNAQGTSFFNAGKFSPDSDRKIDSNTLFEIGSITKTFTATLLADMAQRGEVDLDDPLQEYLPKTAHVPTRGDKQITLRDLATHHSGLPRMPDFEAQGPGESVRLVQRCRECSTTCRTTRSSATSDRPTSTRTSAPACSATRSPTPPKNRTKRS